MMISPTILQALKSRVKYPLCDDLFTTIAIERGLDLAAIYTKNIGSSREFIGARADCLRELVDCPNITEGSVSISETEKSQITMVANDLYASIGEPKIGESSQPTVRMIYE